jgi:Protein of unknown function (DUF998)
VAVVRGVPWWGVVSSAVAPVVLVGGWTVAAGLQPGSFDAVARTISSLAAYGAADRQVMTWVFVVVGACNVLTGLALRPAAWAGRLILVAGGGAQILVAANPQPAGGGSSLAHVVWAACGFVALTAWPVCGSRRGRSVPWALRPAAAATATAVMFSLLVWFGIELIAGLGQVGLSERVLAAIQAVWPLAVVLNARVSLAPGRRSQDPPGAGIPD